MASLSLRDALGLLALYAAEDSPKYGNAATRWLGRLALESDEHSLDDVQLASATSSHREFVSTSASDERTLAHAMYVP